jgi:hypothetical protein
MLEPAGYALEFPAIRPDQDLCWKGDDYAFKVMVVDKS